MDVLHTLESIKEQFRAYDQPPILTSFTNDDGKIEGFIWLGNRLKTLSSLPFPVVNRTLDIYPYISVIPLALLPCEEAALEVIIKQLESKKEIAPISFEKCVNPYAGGNYD